MSPTTIPPPQEPILTPKESNSLKTDIHHFFTNYPLPHSDKLLWDLYSAWISASADHVTTHDIREMLSFSSN